MAISFPQNPQQGDVYNINDQQYTFDGVAWEISRNEFTFSAVQEIDNLGMASDLETRTETELDDIDLGTIKTLAMVGGFVGDSSTNPQAGGTRLPIDMNFSGDITSESDGQAALKIVTRDQDMGGRFAVQSSWGDQVCGIAFQGPTAVDVVKYALGQSDWLTDPFITNAMIMGYQDGPRVVIQKSHLGSGNTGVDPLDPTFTTTRTDVITVIGDTDIIGTLRVTDGISAAGTVNLGAIEDISITGGSEGQTIVTDGNGGLSFADAGGNRAQAVIYSMIFGAT